MAIDWGRLVRQRLLNLPEKSEWGKANPNRAARGQGREKPAPANPWADAARRATSGDHALGAHVSTATGVPWAITPASGAAKTASRALRALLAAVLALFAWIGVRAAFKTDPPAPTPPLPAALRFDEEQAAAVAARVTIAALTWDEDQPQARADALSRDLAGEDPQAGWNREGKQEVVRAVPGEVAVDEAASGAVVTVDAEIATYTREGDDPWQAGGAIWVTVQVPVAAAAGDGRLVAVGLPAFAGRREAERSDARADQAAEDSELSMATRDTAEAFFDAYAAGDVSAVAAPGAAIAAPEPNGWDVKAVTAWRVAEGGGDTRQARAAVTWRADGGGAEYSTEYAVTLERVTGGAAAKWQVSTVQAS